MVHEINTFYTKIINQNPASMSSFSNTSLLKGVRMLNNGNAGKNRMTGKTTHALIFKKEKDPVPQISVIISAYNAEEFIDECMQNLLHQTYFQRLEIIIIDSASTDKTAEKIEPYLSDFTNIRYYKSADMISIYEAWNIGIEVSRGEYITPFSTNDALNPNAYEFMFKALERNPSVALVYGDSYLTDYPHQKFYNYIPSKKYNGGWLWPSWDYRDLLFSCMIGPHPMWRKTIHHKKGLFDTTFTRLGERIG